MFLFLFQIIFKLGSQRLGVDVVNKRINDRNGDLELSRILQSRVEYLPPPKKKKEKELFIRKEDRTVEKDMVRITNRFLVMSRIQKGEEFRSNLKERSRSY